MAVLNNGSTAASYSVPLTRIGWTKDLGCDVEAVESFSGNKTTINACEDNATLEANLTSHEVVVWRISNGGKGGWTSTGAIFNSASLACLTLGEGDASSQGSSSVSWKTCDSSDSQIWTVGKKGSYIKNTAAGTCLSASSDGTLTMAKCDSKSANSLFTYDTSGNIKSPAFKYECITAAADGTASLESCLRLANTQVFEMPSGKLSCVSAPKNGSLPHRFLTGWQL